MVNGCNRKKNNNGLWFCSKTIYNNLIFYESILQLLNVKNNEHLFSTLQSKEHNLTLAQALLL